MYLSSELSSHRVGLDRVGLDSGTDRQVYPLAAFHLPLCRSSSPSLAVCTSCEALGIQERQCLHPETSIISL